MTSVGEFTFILMVKLVNVFFEDNFSEKLAFVESKSAFNAFKFGDFDFTTNLNI